MTTFYHISPALLIGDFIKPTKPIRRKIDTYGSKKLESYMSDKTHYACLAATPAHAFHWVEVLYGQFSSRNTSTVYIYTVEVPYDFLVEFCNGYHFEGDGHLCTPEAALTSYYQIGHNDCEINVFEPVPVTGLYAKISFEGGKQK